MSVKHKTQEEFLKEAFDFAFEKTGEPQNDQAVIRLLSLECEKLHRALAHLINRQEEEIAKQKRWIFPDDVE